MVRASDSYLNRGTGLLFLFSLPLNHFFLHHKSCAARIFSFPVALSVRTCAYFFLHTKTTTTMNNLRCIFTRGLHSKRSSTYLYASNNNEDSFDAVTYRDNNELIGSEPRVRLLVRSNTQALLSNLETSSKFTRREVNLLYREFKHECPAGYITKEQFRNMYKKFFPLGGSSRYAGYVFDTFERDQNGNVTFQAFLLGMSILSRGSKEEKLRWIFNLYDIDKNGFLTKNELVEIVSAVYEMRASAQTLLESDTVLAHASAVFEKIDVNGDGVISLEEFVEACYNDNDISKTLGTINGGLIR